MLDHRVVLAAQPAQLEQLLDDIAAAALQQLLRGPRHVLRLALHLVGDDVAPPRDQLVGQHMLELRQAAARQQRVVVRDLCHQALLRRHRIDTRLLDAQHLRRARDLPSDLAGNLGRLAQRVPQPIDLVEHGQAAAPVAGVHVGAPQLQVAPGHAGIGGQHEYHHVRVGNQAQRQFGLGADRVQPRRVQDDQPLAQQRMREIDDGVAPARDLDHALGIDRVGGIGVALMVEAQRLGLLRRHAHGLDHVLEGFEHALGRGRVQRHRMPVCRRAGLEKIRGRGVLKPGFDRQQPDAGGLGLVVTQLGRAHRGTARRRRQDAAPVVGEEDRIDQFALAARELRNEGDLEPVAAQHVLDALHAVVGLRVVQVVLLQPRLEFGQ
ncbi:hypothetical protein D9M70_478060 [compost metagenome]